MRESLRSVATTAVLILCLLLLPVYSQTSGRSTISGFIFGPQKVPVQGVYVELRNEVNSVVGRVKSDGSGRYSFRGVASGRYSVTVLPLATAFEEQSQEVEISGLSGRGEPLPEDVQKDFYLRAKASSETTVNQVIFAQNVPEAAKKAYEHAASDLEKGKTDRGIEELLKALTLFPDYFLALETLGLEYIRQQKYKDAKTTLGNCVRVNAKSYGCWYGLGYAAYALEENETAIEALMRAVDIDRTKAPAFLILGISQRRSKQYSLAEASLINAKKLDSGKSPQIYWNLALLYAHNLGRYDNAADELELFLKAGPDNPNAAGIRKLIKKFREQAKTAH